ncbi:MAG TPA: GatB/YqeY domain-containing protein [Archangium sp.]|uniref:GatB/YqeY domain-containing protein n=1 Tax=Archangium sp. TaxID=1872627 RepID=UPI002E3171FA|nr:GatB/YqeY domain-containing protein [Archangium sp.]HEX5750094.1 GatB/YqeY domain-containing protein [Archangium sp.]
MATVRERIDADLKDAMRSKNELNTSVLRMLKSAIKYKEVEPGATGPLDEAAILQVIGTLIKQRRDSVEQFKSGGRPELAEKEEQEISVLQNYLPKQLSADELRAEVQAAITEAGAKSAKDMGAVMKLLTPKLQGRAEGRAISEEVKNQLSKL